MNTTLCVFAKAGSGSAEVELAKMGHLASPQGSHHEVGGFRCVFIGGVIVLKYPFPLFLDRERWVIYTTLTERYFGRPKLH